MDKPATEAAPAPFAEALFTDLYELTMLQAYHAEGLDDIAVFELFFRQHPAERRFAVAAGLADVLDYLEHVRFTDDDLAYLADQGQFTDAFLAHLSRFRFTGEVYAVPEGTVVFADEPVVQVVAPIGQAQLVETLVLNAVHFQSVAASKAARVVEAAAGRPVVDFGSRRSHGCDAALKMARASYLAGAAGTSNTLAGKRFGIPVFGTMAHSYIEAHDAEAHAFERFADLYPHATLLVDTYDTLIGVEKVIDLARRRGDRFNVRAIRLDSGNIAELAKEARRRLDQAGLNHVKIIASSGLDEYKIDRLLRDEAPIDGFGVGTKLAVAEDAPTLDFAYKLVEYAGKPRLKLSANKLILPARKQVFRNTRDGRLIGDTIGRFDEQRTGQPLLQPVMRHGRRLNTFNTTLEAARQRFAEQRESLPPALREIAPAEIIPPVQPSPDLSALTTQLRSTHHPT